ncbi:MAG TPA: ATP synthase F0 subunit B [Acidobacteriaceae bacterium]|nr:ATP synthase F0 subunit B [Acidobacteriaceae bacterium]
MRLSKQTPRRFSSLVLFIALLFSVAAAPVGAIAQAGDAATAPSAAQPKAGPESVFKEEHKAEKETEADETSVYRHSPSVQWFAKLLNLDVETAAKLFEYINFAIIVLAIGIPLGRMLPKAMRQRKAKLSADLEVAQARTQDANDRLKAVEEKMAGLDAEIAAIRKQVEEDMRSDEVRNKALIEEETARIVAAAEQEIGVAATQAQHGLKKFAADLAIDRAVSQLIVSADTDRALFAEFAADVAGGGKRRAAKGDHK